MQTIHASPFAGHWYPADPPELRDLIADVLEHSVKRTGNFVRCGGAGFVVPHAAPVYSGTVAAAAYRHIRASRPRRIVLLGFSHRRGGDGIAVPQVETISTPLGESEIDLEGAQSLAGESPFRGAQEQSLCDHSVELQLPFLQMVAPDAKVLPLYVGHLNSGERAAAARRLQSFLNDGTVFLASSDLTHYGREFGYLPFPVNEDTASRLNSLDGDIMSAAASLDADLFLEELRRRRSTVCGYEPISLLLETLRAAPGEEIFQETLDYQTSGEITTDYAHSVSYGALGYFPASAFLLGADAQQALIESARRTMDELQATGERHAVPTADMRELNQRLGVFVTLYQGGHLQGCIGRCHEPEPLALSVPHLTLSAALEDARFEPLRRSEAVEIEISILTPFKRIRHGGSLIAGEHGGYLESGPRAGLLLPKVASERGWKTHQFLQALAQKAGLTAEIYNSANAQLSVFRAQVFGDRRAPKSAGKPSK
jgi:AmmeMemoRadiSam system protein B/AmmeMemoRadiSam system protein A